MRRVDRPKACKPDGFLEFEKHYPHFESSLQEPRFLVLAVASLSLACTARSFARTIVQWHWKIKLSRACFRKHAVAGSISPGPRQLRLENRISPKLNGNCAPAVLAANSHPQLWLESHASSTQAGCKNHSRSSGSKLITFECKVVRDLCFRSSGSRTATSKHASCMQSSARRALPQLRLKHC